MGGGGEDGVQEWGWVRPPPCAELLGSLEAALRVLPRGEVTFEMPPRPETQASFLVHSERVGLGLVTQSG